MVKWNKINNKNNIKCVVFRIKTLTSRQAKKKNHDNHSNDWVTKAKKKNHDNHSNNWVTKAKKKNHDNHSNV